jgi:hypothetical protein
MRLLHGSLDTRGGPPPHPSSVFPAPSPDAGYSIGEDFHIEDATSLVGARFLGLSFEGIVPTFFFSSPASELTIRKVRGTAR